MRTTAILLTALGYSMTALFAAGWIKARFGNSDGLFAAGANRLLVNIPESRQHVLFQERGSPKVKTISD